MALVLLLILNVAGFALLAWLLSKSEKGNPLEVPLAVLHAEVQRGEGVFRSELVQLRRELTHVGDRVDARLREARDSIDARCSSLENESRAQLEKIRFTVDEKLQATLETRLTESFRVVSERLSEVHQGLGEMQSLAVGVGDLKRVLSNVKSRGVLGEVQLESLLSELLTPEQYVKNVKPNPLSDLIVEFAVRLPGGDNGPVFLPMDAKFPLDAYADVADARDGGHREALVVAQKALANRVRKQAQDIASKYIAPPHTTDFAILFIPVESVFGELLAMPGFFEELQRELRVLLAGPTTLSAQLTSLRMGFRTLAIEERASQVWELLGAVKSQFHIFSELLVRTQKKLHEASSVIDSAETRTRVIARKLKAVETMSAESAALTLGLDEGEDASR